MPYNNVEEAVEDLNAQTYQFPPHIVQVRGLDKEGINYIGMPINFEEIVKKIWSDAQSAKVDFLRKEIEMMIRSDETAYANKETTVYVDGCIDTLNSVLKLLKWPY